MRYRCASSALVLALIGCAPSTTTPTAPDTANAANLAASTPGATHANETRLRFEPLQGEAVDAYAGTFSVPENWDRSDSRRLTLHYVRFPATGSKPGEPIVYLAGGPGGSGIDTARRERFPLFMAMRQFGDVIALDQRGTGKSNDIAPCTSQERLDDARAYADEEFVAAHRKAAQACLTFWREAGVDVLGYTTVQNARDLNALRTHLGAEKISLWGISYGTHLALAALKQMDAHIDRVVLASVEGLDQTVKSPAQTDAYFARLQAAIDGEPALKAMLPDIAGLMRRVHQKLAREPLAIEVPGADGKPWTYLLERGDAQGFAAMSIADPQNALRLMFLYAALDQGMTQPLLGILRPAGNISFQAMPLAMDVASGISEARLRRVEAEAKTALLGDVLNFPMPHLNGLMPKLDLGDDFRRAPTSDVPTLVLMGTLDGRTYPEEQREAVAGLRHARIVTVRNAGHNLFMTSPEVTARIESFMRGETVSTEDIDVPLAVPSL
jgi:pimeloyl-ACP methyl ester carboxylesterase